MSRRNKDAPNKMWSSIGRRRLKKVIKGAIEDFRNQHPNVLTDEYAEGLLKRIRHQVASVLYIHDD